MAKVRFHDNNEYITAPEEVSKFLQSQEIIYEHWGVDRLDANLRDNYNLTDEEKQQILDAFRPEIEDISKRRGYLTADIVVLSDQTPNLDELLVKFKAEHHHTDDECRFCVDGHGIFAIKGKDGRYFDVEMEPGDLISVPSYSRHYFTLMDDRKIKAIRLFVTPAGWEAIY
ncbi:MULTISPECIES: acireductone dioxygenase [Bacillales]|jgi:1,2-dihydroxy-3-keto-5-methylthiopentene dioxygenase|uniref:Acireductone dioxygenase n=1 Tax=Brevibacillus aydinogluensis TaxID=927786 RepID=A0AA48RGN3_9BACL|nr:MULTISPECIES: cupin domain-containing protein [Bacillales]REK63733.1 MAG: acireductone dioxygenase [Brevibacillus sp.]MBR8660510.1 cupin domain-containing protein [Brevibacillus sp. NL20B1]MDT3415794.1 1,2-dihydroxy-3-keto-5-methylthiopentene dioxygenase [Brevibacillus aydinogluensis]NNV03872.1 cupin domain-containing protein [Brevibacillus sp. MCWH]UFJ61744.1 cupin domain-containing protein [Anoxybacillus sediminis]